MAYRRSWVPPIVESEIDLGHPFDVAIKAQDEIDHTLFHRRKKVVADRAVSMLIDASIGLEGMPMEVHSSQWGLQRPGNPGQTYLIDERVVACGDYKGYTAIAALGRLRSKTGILGPKNEKLGLLISDTTIWQADDLHGVDAPPRIGQTGLTAFTPVDSIYYVQY